MSASDEFKSVFQEDFLNNLYYSSVKYNGAVGIDRINLKVFEKHLKQNISIISKKALNGKYTFSQYREKLLSKGANKYPRVISIPTLRDKLALKALFRVLASVYAKDTPNLHNIVSEVNNTIIQKRFDSVLRLDVKDFYPSICHNQLLAQLSKRIKKKEIINLIISSISRLTVNKCSSGKKLNNKKGLPQGLPISNVLANVYMQPIDKKYKNRTSIAYFRYVDDILIFCKKNKTEKIKKEIQRDCKNIDLDLHGDDDPEKIQIGEINLGFSYLGYKFKDTSVSVKEKSIEKLRESIIKSLTYYKYSKIKNIESLIWTLNLRITGCYFNERNYGWMFYFSQINDIQLLASLDHFVAKQLAKSGFKHNETNVKKFVRTYYEITKNLSNTKYIPNYDRTNYEQQKEISKKVFNIDVDTLEENEIKYYFRKNIFRSIKDLEEDLSKHS